MHRYQHLMAALARTDADAALIRYAAMVARLGTAQELRFAVRYPAERAPGPLDGRLLLLISKDPSNEPRAPYTTRQGLHPGLGSIAYRKAGLNCGRIVADTN